MPYLPDLGAFVEGNCPKDVTEFKVMAFFPKGNSGLG